MDIGKIVKRETRTIVPDWQKSVPMKIAPEPVRKAPEPARAPQKELEPA